MTTQAPCKSWRSKISQPSQNPTNQVWEVAGNVPGVIIISTLLWSNILDDTKLCFLWANKAFCGPTQQTLMVTLLPNSHVSNVHLPASTKLQHFWERLGYKHLLSLTLSAPYNKLKCLIHKAITVLTLMLDLQGPRQTSNIPQLHPRPCLSSCHGKRTEMLSTYCDALCNGKKSTRKCDVLLPLIWHRVNVWVCSPLLGQHYHKLQQ